MKIILAEKPDMARKIMNSLTSNCQKEEGYFYNSDFIFTYAYGHLTELKMPDEIDDSFKDWKNIDLLPIHYTKIDLKIKDDAKGQFNTIKKLISSNPNAELINACDADREGELIFRNIIRLSGLKPTNVTRMWINSATPEGIKKAFDERKPAIEYRNIGNSAQARSYGDYLVGINACRLSSYFFTGGRLKLSVGRVQTPTLKMIVDREEEIANFKSVQHFNLYVVGKASEQKATFRYLNDDGEVFTSKEQLAEFAKRIGIGNAAVIKNEIKNFTENPPYLYALSDLQVEMNKRHGMSASEVLDICQTLYEKYNFTTYPRTDENRISREYANIAKNRIKNLSIYKNFIDEIVSNNWNVNEKILFDGGEVGSHEALSPTFIKDEQILSRLSEKERTVYEAITKRFLMAFYPTAEGKKQKVIIEKNKAQFSWSSKFYTNKGFLKIKDEEVDEEVDEDIDPEENYLLNIDSSNLVEIIDIVSKNVKPKPPQHFTEGSLIAMMKNPTRYVQSDNDKEILKSVEGIGTEATRANIIEGLKQTEFIKVERKKILPTNKGYALIKAIPDTCTIKSVKMTADFEKKLMEISKGNYTLDQFLEDCKAMSINFKNECSKVASNIANFSNAEVICKCPICDGQIVIGKYGYHCNKCKVSINENAVANLGKKNITKTEAKELFSAGKTKKSYELTFPKSNRTVEAYLTYSFKPTEQYPNKIGFEFVDKKKQ